MGIRVTIGLQRPYTNKTSNLWFVDHVLPITVSQCQVCSNSYYIFKHCGFQVILTWLNLDLGFQICFYWLAWLQIAFLLTAYKVTGYNCYIAADIIFV